MVMVHSIDEVLDTSGPGAILIAWSSTVFGISPEVSPEGLPGCFETFWLLPPP